MKTKINIQDFENKYKEFKHNSYFNPPESYWERQKAFLLDQTLADSYRKVVWLRRPAFWFSAAASLIIILLLTFLFRIENPEQNNQTANNLTFLHINDFDILGIDEQLIIETLHETGILEAVTKESIETKSVILDKLNLISDTSFYQIQLTEEEIIRYLLDNYIDI